MASITHNKSKDYLIWKKGLLTDYENLQGMHVIRELSKVRTRLRLIVNYQIDTFIIPYAPRKGVTLVTPFFVVYQAIKALEVDGEHIKIGCIFTGNLPVFPDFYRYFHL